MKGPRKLNALLLCMAMVFSLFSGMGVTTWANEDAGNGNNTVIDIPAGTEENPAGENPVGDNPQGQDPTGENPVGDNPQGQDPGAADINTLNLDNLEYPPVMQYTLTGSETYWSEVTGAAVLGTDYTTDGAFISTIETATGLAIFAAHVNSGEDYSGKTITLTADIDLGAYEWVPIGRGTTTGTAVVKEFEGTFDGAGHYISNMHRIGGTDDNKETNNSLFHTIATDAAVKKVGVINADMQGYRRSTGIAGTNYGTIESCMSTGKFTANGSGSNANGGIVGTNYGTVINCYSNADMVDLHSAGGVAGVNQTVGNITNCFFTGYVDANTLSASVALRNSGTVNTCYYLENSSKHNQPFDPNNNSGGATAGAFNTAGNITSEGSGPLFTQLNNASPGAFQTTTAGVYPILSWENKYLHTSKGPSMPVQSNSNKFIQFNMTMAQMTGSETKSSYGGYSTVTGIKVSSLANAIEAARNNTDVTTLWFKGEGETSDAFAAGSSEGMLIWSSASPTSIGFTFIPSSSAITSDSITTITAIIVGPSTAGGGGSGSGSSGNHTITGYSGLHGTVTADKAKANPGETVTLTVKPARTYALDTLSYNSTSLKEAAEKDKRVKESYTFTMPSTDVTINASFLKVALIVNSQKGTNGSKVKALALTKAELDALADAQSQAAYLFFQNNNWRAVVSNKIAELGTLFNEAGISSLWKSGSSYIACICSDTAEGDVYGKAFTSYNDLNTWKYQFADNGSPTEVPAGISIEWNSGGQKSTISETIADAQTGLGIRDSGNLRFVYGISEASYNAAKDGQEGAPAGARLPSGVEQIILVYDAPNTPTGSVGTTHNADADQVAETEMKTVEVNTTVKETKGSDGNVTVQASVTNQTITNALKDLAADTALQINAVSTGGNATAAEVAIPVDGLNALVKNNTPIVVKTDTGQIVFDAASLAEIAKAAGTSDVTIAIGNVTDSESSGMNESQKQIAGDNTVIHLEAKDSSGNSVANFGGGKATVAINYEAQSAEYTVRVYRLNEDGSRTNMSAVYKNGVVSWDTDSFSYYMLEEVEIASLMPFADVSEGDWYYEAVEYAYEKGLFSGVSEDKFGPNVTMNRAMLVTVLYKLEGSPDVSGNSGFTDVAGGAWYYNPVLFASQNGIISGYGNGRFGSDDSVSREQMVTILCNYSKYKGNNTDKRAALDAFTDGGSVKSWALDAVQWAVAEGLISGMGDGKLSPGSTATRAQVAAILMNYIENITK